MKGISINLAQELKELESLMSNLFGGQQVAINHIGVEFEESNAFFTHDQCRSAFFDCYCNRLSFLRYKTAQVSTITKKSIDFNAVDTWLKYIVISNDFSVQTKLSRPEFFTLFIKALAGSLVKQKRSSLDRFFHILYCCATGRIKKLGKGYEPFLALQLSTELANQMTDHVTRHKILTDYFNRYVSLYKLERDNFIIPTIRILTR